MDSETAKKNIELLSGQFLEKLEADWQSRKTEEVVDCHDALVVASHGYPRMVTLAAVQLFNHELVREIISDIQAAIKKREQLRQLTSASLEKPNEESNKVQETLNHQ